MEIKLLTLDVITQRCEEETENYRRKLAVDTRYCFELFRRALEDQVQDAYTSVFRIYQPQCARWVLGFAGFADTNEPSPDGFVSEAFARLFQELRGENFKQFPKLESVLAYLKRCVVTAILQQLRQRKAAQLEDEAGENIEVTFESTVESEQIWERIRLLLPDPSDQALVDYRFRQGLMPAAIAGLHPERWASARQVSVALQRVVRTLRGDAELRSRLGLEPD
jgi:DNA-directed RNA polymerase specialized sigma24 family protein